MWERPEIQRCRSHRTRDGGEAGLSEFPAEHPFPRSDDKTLPAVRGLASVVALTAAAMGTARVGGEPGLRADRIRPAPTDAHPARGTAEKVSSRDSPGNRSSSQRNRERLGWLVTGRVR